MKIQNVRLGFATNSSSTHSIVLVPNKELTDDQLFGYFGWEFFTAASHKSKYDYFVYTFYENLMNMYGVEIGKILFQHIFPDYVNLDVGVDHQSRVTLPCKYDSLPDYPEIDMQFFNEITDYFIKNNEITIIGGNDNYDESHELGNYPVDDLYNILPIEKDSKCFSVVKDELYGFWTLFNRKTGSKVLFFINDNKNAIEKSTTPQLVDFKITDYCNFGCKFCYQSSNVQGNHADLVYIKSIIYSLHCLKTFELVLGGGEPTTHPDFKEIVKYAYSKGLITSFTTKNIDLIQDQYFLEFVTQYCSSFAFSPNTEKDIYTLYSVLSEHDSLSDLNSDFQVSIHIVLGTLPKKTITNMVNICTKLRFHVTFLGFKTTGLGSDYNMIDYSWFPEWLLEFLESPNSNQYVSIDTVITKEFKQQFIDMKVPESLFYVTEGSFSCYIDGVNQTIAESSFADSCLPLTKNLTNTIKTIFSTF